MPKATASATATVSTTTTHELKLAPQVKRRLLTSLRVYGELSQQMKAIKLAMTKAKGNIEEQLIDSGETSISIDGYKAKGGTALYDAVYGYKATYVSPVRSYLDKMSLLANGVTMAQIENSTISKPGRPYVKVTLPGGGDDDE